MTKREAQQVTQAMFALSDARGALEENRREAALGALAEAQAALRLVEHAPGISVARAALRLGVSEPTTRAWIASGVLREVPGVTPVQVEVESLHRVSRAVAELRQRGQDRNWGQALTDYLHDLDARKRPAVREGLEQLRRGELESA